MEELKAQAPPSGRNQARTQVNHLCWNEWVVNQKVNHMAVAYIALRNALAVIGVLALVAAIDHLA